MDKYEYVGIWVNEGTAKYTEGHEKCIARKGSRHSAAMKHRVLWNQNRYEVMRGIWKGIMVPSLTYTETRYSALSAPSARWFRNKTTGSWQTSSGSPWKKHRMRG